MLLQTLQRALWQSKPYRSDLLHGICGAHLRLSTDSVSVAGNEQSTASTSSSSVDAEMVGRGPGEPSTSGRVQAKEELVDKYLSLDMCNKTDQRGARLAELLHDFRRHPQDVGSPEVVVATLTYQIRQLTEHFNGNRKHYGAMRNLELMFNRRKRMLKYLRQHNFEAYCFVLQRLGLKDIYVPITSADRYPEGMRHEDPTTSFVRDLRFNFHPQYKQKKTNLWNRLKPKLQAEDPVIR